MQLGIIGAGNVGKALAAGWISAGHTITFGVRDPGALQSGPAAAVVIGPARSGGFAP